MFLGLIRLIGFRVSRGRVSGFRAAYGLGGWCVIWRPSYFEQACQEDLTP